MQNKTRVQDTVQSILEEDIRAREDNFYLYACFLERTQEDNVSSITIEDLKRGKELKLASFESITRARRKVQEIRPELKPNKEIQDIRKEQEQKFINYSLGRIVI